MCENWYEDALFHERMRVAQELREKLQGQAKQPAPAPAPERERGAVKDAPQPEAVPV